MKPVERNKLLVCSCVYTHSKMGKSKIHYAERNTPYTEGHTLYNPNNIKFKTRCRQGLIAKECKETLGALKSTFYILL